MQNVNVDQLIKKWQPVLEAKELPAIKSYERRAHTAVLLENTERALSEERQQLASGGFLTETAPVNSLGGAGYTTGSTATGPVAGFDPVLISLIRRNMPVLMGYDICGVQPMTGPTGLIFAMRSVYANGTSRTIGAAAAVEALYNEANTAFSGAGTHTANLGILGANTSNANVFNVAAGTISTGYGNTTANMEDATMAQMGFSIEKVTVTANSRGLQAGYSLELAQDLKAVHGLNAETELANILSAELLAEINREVVRTVYITAAVGAQSANVKGYFNLADANTASGRWQVEKYKNLVFSIEQDSNLILRDTRRGKGNLVVVSSDVASALSLSGLLDYAGKMSEVTGGISDPDVYAHSTFLGVLNGKIKVYVDPYSVAGGEFYVVGYKGSNTYDAGLIYAPYVPLQMVRAIDPTNYQPKIGFKTRYGLVANPFAQGSVQGTGAITAHSNLYYRKAIVGNIKG